MSRMRMGLPTPVPPPQVTAKKTDVTRRMSICWGSSGTALPRDVPCTAHCPLICTGATRLILVV